MPPFLATHAPDTLRYTMLGLFAWALVLGLVGRRGGRLLEWLLPVPAALALAVPLGGGADAVAMRLWEWAPTLGLAWTARVDGLAQVFAFAVTGIGAAVMAYAPAYMAGDPDRFRLYSWLYAFLAAMLGLVTADNVFSAFVFWELTSVTSFFLIAHKANDESARKAAQTALVVTALGGLALLGGLAVLAVMQGQAEISRMSALSGSHGLVATVIVLVLLGCFTKSAQVPFHFWLPRAMAAPTPVSAYLHSAAMVAAGVYMVLRLSPVLGGEALWTGALVAVGSATAVVGGVLAVTKHDLKQILAYTTVSSLGAMMALAGAPGPDGVYVALAYLVAHGLYKGALFMVAGAVEHATGTRDLRELGGMGRATPALAAAAGLAGLSAIGMVGTAGFVAKELALKATEPGPWIIAAVLVSGLTSAYVIGALVVRAFFGPARAPVRHGAGIGLWGPPALLGAAGVLLGIGAPWFASLLEPMAQSLPAPVSHRPAAWFGLGAAFAMTSLTWLLAAVMVPGWARWQAAGARLLQNSRFDAGAVWDATLNGVLSFALALTRTVQNGYLRRYVLVTVVTFLGLVGWALTQSAPALGTLVENLNPSPVAGYDALVALVVIAAALLAVSATGRLTAITAMGVIGLGVAFLYVSFGAPDLAITQFIVETLTVVMFVLVFYHLPRFRRITRRGSRALDVVIAGTFGAVMSVLVLLALGSAPSPSVSAWHLANAYPEGQGRNVVNVILVDFRALDTLGEIVVLAVAAIGVVALLKLRPRAKGDPPSNP